eukprot:jgi/Mesvir1/27616/Mv07349-RA.1
MNAVTTSSTQDLAVIPCILYNDVSTPKPGTVCVAMATGNNDEVGGWEGPREIDEKAEARALAKVVRAYRAYASDAHEAVTRWEAHYSRLPDADKALVPELPVKYAHIRQCIASNAYFIHCMLSAFEGSMHPDNNGGAGGGAPRAGGDASNDTCVAEDARPTPMERQGTGGVAACGSSHRNGGASDGPGSAPNEATAQNGRDHALIGGASATHEHCSGAGCGVPHPKRKKSVLDPDEGARGILTVVAKDDYEEVEASLQLVPPGDLEKVRCVIRNLVRDWGAEGAEERSQCFDPIVEELVKFFPNTPALGVHGEYRPTVLVPGAGLGRLAWEIARRGFDCQGNEFSYFIMMCSNFILNHSEAANQWALYPWIHTNNNHLSDANQCRPVGIPNVLPASVDIGEHFSMCAGDFVEVYSDPSYHSTLDAVATCFFIDTAHNVIQYLRIIASILKPGGVWINLGPLLYHYSDACNAPENSMDEYLSWSVELSLEAVERAAVDIGLRMVHKEMRPCWYTADPKSLMRTLYHSAFFTMVKPDDPAPPGGS